MTSQTTGKGILKPKQGILLVIVLALAVFAVNALLEWLVALGLNSTVGTVLLWAFTIGLFLFALHRYSLVDIYTVDGVKLTIYRVYIKNPRFAEEIILHEAVFFGDPEQAARKYRISGTKRYGSSRDKYKYQSLVYKRDKKYKQLLFTPNEEVCGEILQAIRK